MYTNLEYRAGERQRRQRQASEAQREKGQQGSRARDKKHEAWEMLAATNAR